MNETDRLDREEFLEIAKEYQLELDSCKWYQFSKKQKLKSKINSAFECIVRYCNTERRYEK